MGVGSRRALAVIQPGDPDFRRRSHQVRTSGAWGPRAASEKCSVTNAVRPQVRMSELGDRLKGHHITAPSVTKIAPQSQVCSC